MKTFTIALALLHLTTLSLAAPHANLIGAYFSQRDPFSLRGQAVLTREFCVEDRQFLASLTFYGAGPSGASFFQQIPADDQLHKISKASHSSRN